jgi:DNA-binding NarL/FixJ family response regulator
MGQQPLVTLLVVSKFRVSGEALASYLSNEDSRQYCVATAACLEAHELDFEPDMVILSCVDECPAGVDAIRALFPSAKLIVISRSPSPAWQAAWLRKGVAGIINEADSDFGLEQLSRACAAVQAGEVWASRELLAQIVRNGKDVAEPETGLPLTPREKEMMALLHMGLTNAAIGDKLCISEKTVKAHLTNVYRKLGVTNRVQATLRTHHLRRMSDSSDSSYDRDPLCTSPLPIVQD